MNGLATVAAAAAFSGTLIGVIGCWLHIRRMLSLPYKPDVAEPKGSATKGIVYAYTLGMAPWGKESTRRHAFSYMRGVLFHIGIFVALAVFVLSPWLSNRPYVGGAVTASAASLASTAAVVATLLGGLAGLLGIAARLSDRNLRVLSTQDDYFSVALVTCFVLAAALSLVRVDAMPLFHLIGAATLAYLPFGKVRHCIYFFFSRMAFGAFFGHRGIIEGARNQL